MLLRSRVAQPPPCVVAVLRHKVAFAVGYVRHAPQVVPADEVELPLAVGVAYVDRRGCVRVAADVQTLLPGNVVNLIHSADVVTAGQHVVALRNLHLHPLAPLVVGEGRHYGMYVCHRMPNGRIYRDCPASRNEAVNHPYAARQ